MKRGTEIENVANMVETNRFYAVTADLSGDRKFSLPLLLFSYHFLKVSKVVFLYYEQ